MWETVDLREIRVFLAIADELHFGRAAERLGVTQSRVSQSLRELELKLGSSLVHRTSRRVALTAAGERFLAEIRPVDRELASVLERASNQDGALARRLRLGLLNALPQPAPLIQAITAFEKRHPACHVEVKELLLSTQFEPLRHGEVDLMVCPPPADEPDLVRGPVVARDPRVLAMAADHPLSGRDSVTTEDIADYEVIDLTGSVPPELAPRLIPEETPSGRPMKRRRLQHHDWSELQTSIARGRIVQPSFPGQFGHPGIVSIPIADMPDWESVLVWRRRDETPTVRAFVDVAKEQLAEA
jgi:DNA-binding transcriptional LysR family regulator